uniref:DUF4347 domain-containing protein n=1 Tax=Myxosarcina sp. GI1 TaxID=1541065 RepID=UPI0012E03D0B
MNLSRATFITTDVNMLPTKTKLVFIDSQVENYQALAAGLVPEAEVIILSEKRDGIVQISEALSQRQQIAEVHLVSHGSPGCLYLGNTQLSLDTLDKYREDLKTCFSSYSLRSTLYSLLIYGCNVAAGDAGEEFIAKLHDITSAEIAASTTRTGNAAKGGNWNLEYRTANISAENAFSLQTQNSYAGILAYILIDNKTSGTISGTTTTTNPLVRTFNITNNVTVSNLTLGLNVTHARRGDLLFTLTSPDGTTVTAVTNGSDANTNYDLLLQDGSANPINDGNTDTIAAPIYSADRIAAPSNPFSAFNGKSAQGTWTLRIADTVPASNNGTFNSARLTLNLPTSLNFQNPTLVSGTNLQPGAVYRFSNVITGVDALVTVTAFNGGATLNAIDSTANGTAAAFQPEVNVPANAANASVDFAFSFVKSGTTTQTTVNDFLLSPIDVDGDNVAIREYVELSNISAYTVETGSNLTTTYTAATETTRFEAKTNAVVAGIDPSVTANIATAQFGGVKSFTYKAGALQNGANAQTRLFSLAANTVYINNYTTPVTTTVNQTPVLDLDANNSSTATGANFITSYTENAAGVSIGDIDTTITDADDTNIEFAVITLTNPQASDLLAIGSLPGGITGSYDSATQTVTLTGSATLANYQTAIRAVTFSNTSDNPSTTPRTVTVVVNDGETNSNTATTTINVTAVNDPPVLDLDANDSSTAT